METISKKRRMGEVRLMRKMLKRHDLLILKRDLCNGCGLCIEVCPKDAISMKPAVAKEGSLLHTPVLDIDEKKCILCGICAVICPLNALEAWVNDEKIAMFVENEAFPFMIKKINVDKELCVPDCGIKCEESCPRDAIMVAVERQDGQVEKVIDVQILNDLCIYCKACEYACPYGLITVERPLEGLASLESERCPEGCHICVDVCPSNAIKVSEGGKLEVDGKLCIACKACQTICPEGAIHVDIEQVLHTQIKSSTWINLLQRFASCKVAAKEMATKSAEKRRSRIRALAHRLTNKYPISV